MAEISVKITGHSVWDSSYAVYKIEINAKERWCVYRRFSAFHQLHAGLQRELGQAYVDLNLTLPEKDYQGSYLASRSSIVEGRIPVLQKFLNDLILHKVPSMKIKNFFDFEGKGSSGVRMALGGNAILKESFVRTSYGLLTKVMWHNWKTNYVVLTRNGTLYFLRSMYDSPTEAIVRYDLTSTGVHISGDAASFSVRITTVADGQTRFVRLAAMEDFAFWLRSLGEFGTKGTAANVATNRATKQVGNAAEETKAAPVIEDRQGTKTDELSAMYGI